MAHGRRPPLHPEQPTIIADALTDPRLDETGRQFYTQGLNAASSEAGRANEAGRALLFFPLNVSGRWIGHIIAIYHQHMLFPESEIRRLESLAGQAAVAVEGLRLLDETRRRIAELDRLNRIVSSAAASLDLQNSLDLITRELSEAFRAFVGIALLDRPRLPAVVTNVSYWSDTPVTIGMEIPLADNPSSLQAINTRRTVLIEHPQTSDLTRPLHEVMRSLDVQTLMIVPLLAGGEVIGAVALEILKEPRSFTLDEIRQAEAIVLQTAAAIQNARLFEQTQQVLAETESLYQGSAAIQVAADAPAILVALQRHSLLGDSAWITGIDLYDTPWKEDQPPEWAVRVACSQVPFGGRYHPANLAQPAGLAPATPRLTVLPGEQLADIIFESGPAASSSAVRSDLLDAWAPPNAGPIGLAILVPLVAAGAWIGHVWALFPPGCRRRRGARCRPAPGIDRFPQRRAGPPSHRSGRPGCRCPAELAPAR